MSMGWEEINKRLGYHELTSEMAGDVTTIRTQYKDLMKLVADTLPEGRAKSLALTELEVSSMWAIKAIAENGALAED